MAQADRRHANEMLPGMNQILWGARAIKLM